MRNVLFFPGDGAGLGSCILSLSVLLELRKIYNFNLYVSWHNRQQLSNKSICIFRSLFDVQSLQNINEFNDEFSLNFFLEKGILLKKSELLNSLNLLKYNLIVKDYVNKNLLKKLKINNIDKKINFNLSFLNPLFTQKQFDLLKKYKKGREFGCLHIRTGNEEFNIKSNYWIRKSILKSYFHGFLILILKYKIKLNFKNKLNNCKSWIIFSDSQNLKIKFEKKDFKVLKNKFLNETNHQNYYFKDTKMGINFYKQNLFEIYLMSNASFLIADYSGFAESAIMISKKTEYINLNNFMGIFKLIDKTYIFIIRILKIIKLV